VAQHRQSSAMEFEWDEAKRLTTLEKHGLDFLDAGLLFGNPHAVAAAKVVGGEPRWLAVGLIEDVYVTAIFTWRGDVIRLISMRKARDDERKRHQALFSE
jgi:uncharacterized protein